MIIARHKYAFAMKERIAFFLHFFFSRHNELGLNVCMRNSADDDLSFAQMQSFLPYSMQKLSEKHFNYSANRMRRFFLSFFFSSHTKNKSLQQTLDI